MEIIIVLDASFQRMMIRIWIFYANKGGINMAHVFVSINWAAIAPLIGIQLILMIIALIDLARVERTNGPKWMWICIIVFATIPGPIAYFIFGRGE